MKSAYVKPTMTFEGFKPTEYVAACYVNVPCVGSYFYDGGAHECDGDLSFIRSGKSDTDNTSTGTRVNLYTPAQNRSILELFAIWFFGGYWNRWDEFAEKYLNNQPVAGDYWVHNELGGHILTSASMPANYPGRPNHS